MEITRVKIVPSDDEGIAAYASITIDDCFMIHGLKLKISKKGDYFLFMPQRNRADGAYVDIVLPLDNETRRMIEEKVFAAHQIFADEPCKGTSSETMNAFQVVKLSRSSRSFPSVNFPGLTSGAFLRMRTSFVRKVPFPSFPRSGKPVFLDSGSRSLMRAWPERQRSALFGTRSTTRTYVRGPAKVY